MRKVKPRPGAKERSGLPRLLRIIVIVIFSVLFVIFFAPMPTGIVNIGNIAGIIFCAAVILLCAFFPLLRKKKALRVLSYTAGALMSCFVIYCGVISAFMISGMHSPPSYPVRTSAAGSEPTHTVIVLGCQAINGKPSTMLTLRLNKAIGYLKEHADAVCIVCGGQGANEIEPEAFTMKRYLTENGVDESIIYAEPESINTEENIRYSKYIIEENGLPKDVVIISESYHVYRGIWNAQLRGLNASAVYAEPEEVLITLPSYWLREIFAVTRDYLAYFF
ncbi:MAG: YdcF family protein [Ruminiclostridium sp.]|nr:YdcF family protein [Ruminiclostridium sp.]